MSASVSTEVGKYVSPILANLSATASKTVNYEVLQSETVTVADISETFRVTISDASAAAILNAFHVYERDASDGTDASANVDVSFSNTAEFREAVQQALIAAVSDAGDDISGYMFGAGTGDVNARLNTEIKRAFMNDNFPNLLATFYNNPLELSVDYSGAANNMGTNIADSLNDEPRRYFFTQLPTSNVREYQVDANQTDITNELDFLPLLKGDKLVLVWNATVSLSASKATTEPAQPTQNSTGSGAEAPASASASNRADLNYIGVSYAALDSVHRRIAVEITMGTGGSAWSVVGGKLSA